jgi:CDP-glycerol glycerophosphotransferase
MKHTWFQRQAFKDTQNDAEEQEEKEESEFSLRFDFNDPIQYRYQRYRKLEKLTVLGALYKKSLFTENNIRFNEEQYFYSDPLVATAVLKYAKNIKCNENALYVKRHHNDKQNNPAISQYVKEETMPDYFVAYKNAMKMAGDNKQLKNHLNVILGKFIVKEYIKKIRWSEDEKWKGEYYEQLVELSKGISRKALKNNDFTHAEKKMIYAFMEDDFDKMQKKSIRILFRRKVKRMIKKKRVRYKTITLYVFNKMKLKENWIVFESFMGRNCSGQPKYIYKYLQENYGNKYKYIWVVDRKDVKIPGNGYKKCKRFSLRYYYYMNRSKYWVNNMRQPLSIPRREETVMLSTWHGTPLKRLVFDMEDVHSANPRYKDIVYRQTRGWDYLLSDNPFSTEKFQSCFLFEKEKILEYGYPANDPMYAPDREERAAKIKKRLGISKDKKVILYAPTWRDDNFYEAGQYGFDLDLDVNRLQKEFGDEYVLLLRLHYFIVDNLDLSQYGDFTVDGSSYDDITDLYLISDILITDYSSVFFDYANLKRPVLYFTYDLEKYRDVLRGFYLDMEKDLPGPLLLTNDEVVDAIKNIDEIQETYKERYEEFYNRFCCVDDGHAAQRVVEKVFQ